MKNQDAVVAKPISAIVVVLVGLCLGIALSVSLFSLGARLVTVSVDGVTFEHRTQARTVAELLAELNISPDQFSSITPNLHSLVYPAAEIQLRREEALEAATPPLPNLSAEYITEQIAVPFKVTKKPSGSLYKGTEQIVTEGKEGLIERTRKVVRKDDEFVADVLIVERVLAEPVDQVVLVGKKEPIKTVATSSGTYRYREVKEMLATAYYPGPECTYPSDDGITAIGLEAGYGIVAVDPRVIPLRSQVYIPGYGVAVAGDVGGAIKGDRVDLCYETLEEAIQFGRQWVKVYILE